jgi:hypothetical protein
MTALPCAAKQDREEQKGRKMANRPGGWSLMRSAGGGLVVWAALRMATTDKVWWASDDAGHCDADLDLACALRAASCESER